MKAQGWVEEIRRFSMPTVKIMLVGNKIDRFAERRVSTEDAAQFAKENQLMYYETSSKTNENDCVNKAFYRMIEESVDQLILTQEAENKDLREMAIKQTHRLVQSQLVTTEKKSCC